MKSHVMKSAAAIAIAIAAYQTPQAAAADQSAPQSADAVVSQLTQRMDAVSGYTAHIKLAVQLHTFPFLAANLEGTTSYTKPGHYTVTFDSLPSLGSAFQKVSGDVGDPAAWRSKYAIALDPSSATTYPNTLALRLTEKVKGQVDHALAFVDLSSFTVTRMEWYYRSGGRIAMEQHFAPVGGVLLVDTQAADIDMPGYKATVNAAFDGYNVRVGPAAQSQSQPNNRSASRS